MRLTHIKLSGFKSFVDPTTIPLPGQRIAIVGPNGCGKSNVMDAVRWVLGESSAKQLRGESMQDVIFNGSTTRQAISRASVELLFDNSDYALSGAWGQYSEVAIKRVLTRHGDSDYYINNQPVRRKDITDLFLGTGVGSRGYAIIEQGMITRIIEARPEEMRTYLEEVAGVSKYRERRRDTEHRIKDTRAHLERISDLQQELARQTEHLKNQAQITTQYHDLQKRLTEKQTLLTFLQREEAVKHETQARQKLASIETQQAALSAEITHLQTQIENVRQEQFSAQEAVDIAQKAYLEAKSQLAHLDASHQAGQQQISRLKNEQQILVAAQKTDRQQLTLLCEQHAQWQAQAATLSMELETATLALETTQEPLAQCEERHHNLQHQLARIHQIHAEQSRQQAVLQNTLHHLNQNGQQLQLRNQALLAERTQLEWPDPQAPDRFLTSVTESETALAKAQACFHSAEADYARLLKQRELATTRRAELNNTIAQAQAQLSASQTLIAHYTQQDTLATWLGEQGLEQTDPLWQQLQVNHHWQSALEAVLGSRLMARLAPCPAHLPPGAITLIDQTPSDVHPSVPSTSLLQQINASPALLTALADWLASVYLADNLETALSKRHTLQAGECFVTPEGHQVFTYSLVFHAPASDQKNGLLFHNAQAERLTQQLGALKEQLTHQDTLCAALEQQESSLHASLQAQKKAIHALETDWREATLAQAKHTQQLAYNENRAKIIAAEQSRLNEEKHQTQQKRKHVEQELETLNVQLEALEQEQAKTESAYHEAQWQWNQWREKAQEAERSAHQIALSLQASEQKNLYAAQHAIDVEQRLTQTQERLNTLAQELTSLEKTLSPEVIQMALQVCNEAEHTLDSSQKQLAQLNLTLQTYSEKQAIHQQALNAQQEQRAQCLLKHQEARIAVEHFNQTLAQQGADETQWYQASLHPPSPDALRREITQITRALDALGPVNLAALTELAAAHERETYLAQQSDDLVEALTTLEKAIVRIDQDSKKLLHETYLALNQKIAIFFPLLFGGGKAELVFTGDDILHCGLYIIAQPPGKKNTTLYLLSGGEKALTAISFIFSLFALNPAPFCLLDEVDAPLDDANTSRFCDLVKQLSAQTQFVYISHNRLTMEMAEQLIGVTMHEQGVSRIVSVDIQQALQMQDTDPHLDA